MLYHSRAAKSHLFSVRLPHFPVYLTAFSLYWLLFSLLSLQFWPISPLCLMESWQNCHKCSQMTFYSQWLSQSCTYAKREIKKKSMIHVNYFWYCLCAYLHVCQYYGLICKFSCILIWNYVSEFQKKCIY